jgi:hypothetical protein
VSREDAFTEYLRAGLESYGIEADEVEMAVMTAVWQAFRPAIEGLLATDLSAVEPEPDFDPSRPPAG